MSSIVFPFFATNGAVLYTERIRNEKDTIKNKEFENDSMIKNDAHRYSGKLMNYIWSQYNKSAPFQFQRNVENTKITSLNLLGAQIETTLNSTTTKHY